MRESRSLTHHGILGMKWGVRRFQNKNGKLTSRGKKRYSAEDIEMRRKRAKTVGRAIANVAALRATSRDYDQALTGGKRDLAKAFGKQVAIGVTGSAVSDRLIDAYYDRKLGKTNPQRKKSARADRSGIRRERGIKRLDRKLGKRLGEVYTNRAVDEMTSDGTMARLAKKHGMRFSRQSMSFHGSRERAVELDRAVRDEAAKRAKRYSRKDAEGSYDSRRGVVGSIKGYTDDVSRRRSERAYIKGRAKHLADVQKNITVDDYNKSLREVHRDGTAKAISKQFGGKKGVYKSGVDMLNAQINTELEARNRVIGKAKDEYDRKYGKQRRR